MMRVHDTATPTQLGLFLWLVFAISAPFWLLGAFSEAMLLPHLPLSALMAACPGLVALALVWRSDGEKGARALLARLWDWRRIPGLGWAAALALCVPVLLALAWGLMWLAGAPLPDKVRIVCRQIEGAEAAFDLCLAVNGQNPATAAFVEIAARVLKGTNVEN